MAEVRDVSSAAQVDVDPLDRYHSYRSFVVVRQSSAPDLQANSISNLRFIYYILFKSLLFLRCRELFRFFRRNWLLSLSYNYFKKTIEIIPLIFIWESSMQWQCYRRKGDDEREKEHLNQQINISKNTV